MKRPTHHLIAEVQERSFKVESTIGVDLGDIWSHDCTLSEDGEVVDRRRFRTTASGPERRFRDLEPVRIAMEAGTHSIWVREQLRELGYGVIVANVRELRAEGVRSNRTPVHTGSRYLTRVCVGNEPNYFSHKPISHSLD